MESDEQDADSCRICRSGPELDQPLYHPCKCAGSIRYCHQDCLIEWLQHSRKKYCELCNHPFIFLKRYRNDMPADGKLPGYLYLQRLAKRSVELLKWCTRAALVAFAWLAVLPWVNVHIWRFLFGFADLVAWNLVPNMAPPSALDTSILTAPSAASNAPAAVAAANSTVTLASTAASEAVNVSANGPTRSGFLQSRRALFRAPSLKNVVKSLVHDCFEGQVLTCVIVVLFIGIFLLREWIMQNVPQHLDNAVAGPAQQPQQQQRQRPGGRELGIDFHDGADAHQRRLLPPATAAARGNAEAEMQAQMRQAALELRLAQLRERLERAESERHETLAQILEEGQGSAQASDQTLEATNNLDGEGEIPTAGTLREMRLRRFDQRALRQDQPEQAALASSTVPGPTSPLTEQVKEGGRGAGFPIGFDSDVDEDRTSAQGPSQEAPRPSSRHGSSVWSEQRDWPSWTNTAGSSTPKRHSAVITDGNASSLFMPSWQEGSAVSEPVHLPAHDDADADNASWGVTLAAAADSVKGKGRADELELKDEADPSPVTSGVRTQPDERANDEAAAGRASDRSKTQQKSPDDLLDTTIAGPSTAPEGAQQPSASELSESEQPNGQQDLRAAVGSTTQAAAQSIASEPSPSSQMPEDAPSADAIDAARHLADVALALPGRDAVAAAAANGDPVAEALLDAADGRGARNAAFGNDDIDDDDDDDDDDDEFENEAGFLEEVDFMMEAIGMRGPWSGLLQNLVTMIFLCSFVMFIFIALPHLIGKLLGPGTRLLHVLTLPVAALRYITDPLFDAIISFGTDRLWPWAARVLRLAAKEAASPAPSPATLAERALATVSLWFRSSSLAQEAPTVATERQLLISEMAARLTETSNAERLKADLRTALYAGALRPLSALRDYVQQWVREIDARTLTSSSSDRVLSVGLGHAYWLLALGIQKQLSARTPSRPAAAEESTMKLIVDQQLLILKVVVFFFIELIVFPLGCGLLLDLCLMPIFAESTIFNWLDRARIAPFTFAFTRWMGGTIYMFLFAQYVHSTRGVLRPGILCWIRDPNDPSFHPIKDILDKKTLTQLRKIGASAVMYAGILIASVGVNAYFLRYALGFTGILPLRWKPMISFSEVPLDLLVVHLVVPWLANKVDAEKAFASAWSKWWKAASRRMRLSSYMIGGEFPEERGSHVAKTWSAWLLGKRASPAAIAAAGSAENKTEATPPSPPEIGPTDEDDEVAFIPDGGFCRVPGDDKSVTSGPLIIPVHEDGSALDERGADAIEAQEQAMKNKTPKPTYVTIYMPPRFRLRIGVLLTLLWLTECVSIMTGLAVPLALGRWAWALLADLCNQRNQREPHDFYSFCVGAGILGVSAWISCGTARLCRRAKLRASSSASSSARRLPGPVAPAVFVAISLLRRTARLGQACILGFGLVVVVPLLVGLTINQYVVVPLRFASDTVPDVELWQSWATGMIECKLLVEALQRLVGPTSGPARAVLDGLEEIRNGGFRRPKVLVGYRRVVLPISVLCSCLLVGPACTAELALRLVERQRLGSNSQAAASNRTAAREQTALRIGYGVVLVALCLLQARAIILKRMEAWTAILKDEVFLESTELKNYEAPAEAEAAAAATSAEAGASTAAGDIPTKSDKPVGQNEGQDDGNGNGDGTETAGLSATNGQDSADSTSGNVEAASEKSLAASTSANPAVVSPSTGCDQYEAEGTLPDVLFR